MKYHHRDADAQGESHWRAVAVILEEQVFAPPAQGIFVSESEAARAGQRLADGRPDRQGASCRGLRSRGSRSGVIQVD